MPSPVCAEIHTRKILPANSPPGEVDTVIEILTTRQMILSGTNIPPGEVDTVIETLTTGQMIPPGTNSPPG